MGRSAIRPGSFRRFSLLLGQQCATLGGKPNLHKHSPSMKKVIALISLGLVALIALGLLPTRCSPKPQELSQGQFVAMVESNLLAQVRVYYPPQAAQVDGVAVMLYEVRGTFHQSGAASQEPAPELLPLRRPSAAHA
jgi:hypothetical protein